MPNCIWCKKPTNTFFIIADDIENPKPYHKECIQEMLIQALIKEEK